jgi:allantoin racemase
VKRVRIVTPVIAEALHVPEDVARLAGTGTELSIVQIERGPASIESAFDAALAAPETIAKVLEAEREGVDAVVIDCMDDPALEAAREVVSIPVLGPSQTSMHLACLLGHRFSVVTVLERSVAPFEDLARRYGVADRLASVRWVDIPVLDLGRERGRLAEELAREARAAIEGDGAHVVVLGCTGMLGCAAELREALRRAGLGGVPVIDPLPATVRVAEALLDLGLAHSERTYPAPPAKAIAGYGFLGWPGSGG